MVTSTSTIIRQIIGIPGVAPKRVVPPIAAPAKPANSHYLEIYRPPMRLPHTVRAAVLKEAIRSLQRVYYAEINASKYEDFARKLQTVETRLGNRSSYIVYLLKSSLSMMKRGYEPRFVLFNTGASDEQMASLLSGRGMGYFPISARKLDECSFEHVATGFITYGVNRPLASWTLQVCLRASELLDWAEEEIGKGKSIIEAGNFDRIDATTVLPLMKKGTISGRWSLLKFIDREKTENEEKVFEATRQQGLPSENVILRRIEHLGELYKKFSDTKYSLLKDGDRTMLHEWLAPLRFVDPKDDDRLVHLWVELLSLVDVTSVSELRCPIVIHPQVMDQLRTRNDRKKEVQFIRRWNKKNPNQKSTPARRAILLAYKRILDQEAVNLSEYFTLRNELKSQDPEFVQLIDDLIWEGYVEKFKMDVFQLLELCNFLRGLGREDPTFSEKLLYVKTEFQSKVDREEWIRIAKKDLTKNLLDLLGD